MSSVVIKDVIRGVLQYGLKVTVLAVVWMMISRRKQIQRRCFAAFYSRFVVPGLKVHLRTCKSELFAPLLEMTSCDPELRANGSIRVLEIGIGTGMNLEFYPPGCRLISVEPNPYFQRVFEMNREAFAHLSVERFVTSQAEDMSEICDNTVDVVVSTYVLCSVLNMKLVLSEILRVLSPGGKFFYLEHVSYDAHSWSKKMQQIVEPFWKVVSDDCSLTAPTSELIRAAGFSQVEEKNLHLNQVFFIVRPHITGVATK